MATQTLPLADFEVYSENHRCETCQHWHEAFTRRVSAITERGLTETVGQCMSNHPGAPYSELEHGTAYAFTSANSFCAGFTLHPDIERAEREERATCASLARDLARQGNGMGVRA